MAKKSFLMDKTVQFLLVLLLAVLAIWAYNRYSSGTLPILNEGELQMGSSSQELPMPGPPVQMAPTPGALAANPSSQELRSAGCVAQQQLTPQDLLPNDNDTLWAEVSPKVPSMGGAGLAEDRAWGINAVSQVQRNPNLQLRSEPPNPQVPGITPFNATTIGPDIMRRPLELGEC